MLRAVLYSLAYIVMYAICAEAHWLAPLGLAGVTIVWLALSRSSTSEGAGLVITAGWSIGYFLVSNFLWGVWWVIPLTLGVVCIPFYVVMFVMVCHDLAWRPYRRY